jgi:hypothetical protein
MIYYLFLPLAGEFYDDLIGGELTSLVPRQRSRGASARVFGELLPFGVGNGDIVFGTPWSASDLIVLSALASNDELPECYWVINGNSRHSSSHDLTCLIDSRNTIVPVKSTIVRQRTLGSLDLIRNHLMSVGDVLRDTPTILATLLPPGLARVRSTLLPRRPGQTATRPTMIS